MSDQKRLGLSSFISNEMFGFGKKEEPPKTETSVMDWFHKHTKDMKLIPGMESKEGKVSLHGKQGSMFIRAGKEIDHPLKEFAKDLHEYESIFIANKSHLAEFGKAQKSFVKALDNIAGTETTYEEVRSTVLGFKDQARKFMPPSSVGGRFHEPTTRFLGDFRSTFLDHTKNHFNPNQIVNDEQDAVELDAIDSKEMPSYVKLAFDIIRFRSDLGNFDDEDVGQCWDQTDSPTRGFMNEISDDKEVLDILNIFGEHGMTDTDQNAGLLSVLMARLDFLEEGLVAYIRASVH